MRCKEALHHWQQALLDHPVDQDTLKEAYTHISACWDVCARTFCAAPDVDVPARAEQRARQTDLYEALGLAAEEESDEHAHSWARLRRNRVPGEVKEEALVIKRARAVAAWQAAANYSHDGLRVGETAFLTESLQRLIHKRLEPGSE